MTALQRTKRAATQLPATGVQPFRAATARSHQHADTHQSTPSPPVMHRSAVGKGRGQVRRQSDRLLLFIMASAILSLLGLFYLVQASRVATLGYMLSDLQRQQLALDQQNELLQYQVDRERTLAHAYDTATQEYQMQPIARGAQSAPAAATQRPKSARDAPQVSFILVQRPDPEPPAASPPSRSQTLFERLWNRIVGVGQARSQ